MLDHRRRKPEHWAGVKWRGGGKGGRWLVLRLPGQPPHSNLDTRPSACLVLPPFAAPFPRPHLPPALSLHHPIIAFRSAIAGARLLAGVAMAGAPLAAQTVTTVRETEFRSRWVDQQVDRPQIEVGPQIPLRDAEGDFGGGVTDTIHTLFRTGPVVFRANLNAGFEYTSQQANANFTSQPSTTSFFAAPTVAAFYDREVGPWTVSARYSVGYIYYFDRNYVAAGGNPGTPDTTTTVVVEPERTVLVRDRSRDTVEFVNGIRVVRPGFRTERIAEVTDEQVIPGQEARAPEDAIPSQSAGLDFRLTLSRLTIRSSGGAAFGSGFDTNRGGNQDRLTLNESLSADYQLTEYTRAGVLLSGSYESNAALGSEASDVFSRVSGSFYTDYFFTGKTRLRFELGAGQETREFASGETEERTFSQGQVRANYVPTDKLALEASIGLGVSETTGVTTVDDDGIRNIYSLTVNYRPTAKINVRMYLGLEATATEPEFSLAAGWSPRDTTTFSLSAYQLSGVSTLSFSQNRISRGFLASAQQRFLQRGTFAVSGGWEEYEDLTTTAAATELEPYSFYGVSLSYEFSRWMALEALYRSSSQATSFAGAGGGRETRASLSLRLTF